MCGRRRAAHPRRETLIRAPLRRPRAPNVLAAGGLAAATVSAPACRVGAGINRVRASAARGDQLEPPRGGAPSPIGRGGPAVGRRRARVTVHHVPETGCGHGPSRPRDRVWRGNRAGHHLPNGASATRPAPGQDSDPGQPEPAARPMTVALPVRARPTGICAGCGMAWRGARLGRARTRAVPDRLLSEQKPLRAAHDPVPSRWFVWSRFLAETQRVALPKQC